jgi:hypothetical protein
MQAFTDFILQVMYPPNPIRNLDNSRTPNQDAGFNPVLRSDLGHHPNCDGCHVTDRTGNRDAGVRRLLRRRRASSFEARPSTSRSRTSATCTRRSACSACRRRRHQSGEQRLPRRSGPRLRLLHDGSIDTLFRFHNGSVFNNSGGNPGGFTPTPAGDTLRFQVETFMLAFDSNLFPIVGQQATRRARAAATSTRASICCSRRPTRARATSW